jgi:hypothetical protein
MCDKENIVIYITYHNIIQNKNDNFIYFGVNEIYNKDKSPNKILEYELEKYNPFLQKRGYMETSSYLHVYWNNLYKDKEMVGFAQYDMNHKSNYENLSKDTIYLLKCGRAIVNNNNWDNLMFSNIIDLLFLIKSYNNFFHTKYSMQELENMPLSLWQTNIYPVKIYEKLCRWLEVLVEEIYPWSNEEPYQTHFGSIGGYTERALSIFNAFEIYEGNKYENLYIEHNHTAEVIREQYNINFYFNKYSQDIHTKFVDNITGNYNNVNFCMFKSQCYLNGIYYSCERINKNDKNGLYFTKNNCENYKEYAFDIEGEDPRIFILNNEVYVIFICLSPYEYQNICIGITKFDEWKPYFLQVENMNKNIIEKNWAPFVKDNKLYFVYNYDPLIILHYDLNPDGICNVIFKQDNINLPINTSNTYLRGGSNLIHYKDEYYIGGCHSRIYKNGYEHYTHIILLDTKKWELIYVSKQVMYLCNIKESFNSWHLEPGSKKQIDYINNTIIDKTPFIIQDPISIYKKDDKYFITINLRDCITFLYEILFANLFDFVKRDKCIGYYDNYIKDLLM